MSVIASAWLIQIWFLELSGFFPNIFDTRLVESKDLEPEDMEGWLCHKWKGLNNRNLLPQGSGGPESKIKELAGLVPSVRQNLFSACS